MQNYSDKNIILKRFRGVFVKIQGPNYFLDFLIYFPTKNVWTRSTVVWTGLTRPAHGPRHSRLILATSCRLSGLDLINVKRFLPSNLEHSSRNGWRGGIVYSRPVKNRDRAKGDAMASSKEARACGIAHQKSICFFLHDLDYEREPFYSHAETKTIERRLATRRRLGHPSTVVRATPDGAPTLGMAPVVAVGEGAPPSSDGLARGAPTQWLDDSGAVWQWRLDLASQGGRQGGVYIGREFLSCGARLSSRRYL
jgi:hypothetical protein